MNGGQLEQEQQVMTSRCFSKMNGDRPASLDAWGRVLSGEFNPQGRLPVELPAVFEREWGMSYEELEG